MSRRRRTVRPWLCPTRDKVAYPSKIAALRIAAHWVRPTGAAALRVYPCRCGAFHLTSNVQTTD